MTFLELRQLVSYWADDLQQTYFTPTQINRFLNNAQRETQKLLLGAGNEFYTICKITTCVINQRDYIMPEDFYKLNRIEIIASGTAPNESVVRLNPITPNQRDLVTYNVGTPNVYYFQKNRIIILPAPDNTYTLRMFYSYKVMDMVLDTDVPDCPEPYQEFIAVLATIDCFLKDGRDASALIEKRDYYMNMFKADAAQRNVDESRTVIYTGTYDGYEGNYW